MKTVNGMDVVRTEKVTALCPTILNSVTDLWRSHARCGPQCYQCRGKLWIDDVKLELGPKRKGQLRNTWTAAARLTYPKRPLDWSGAKYYEFVLRVEAGKRVRIPYKPRGTWGIQWHAEVRGHVRLLSERVPTYSWGIKRLLAEAGVIDWEYKGAPVGSGGFGH